MANVRKKKNYILSLTNGTETATTQVEKHRLTFDHFHNHLGSYAQRKHGLNFEALGWQPQQLLHLDTPFTEQEVAATIKAMPKEKAPGLDGFKGAFFSSCWRSSSLKSCKQSSISTI
jgi:Mn-dependent DtxR family transcriptional regulator